MSKFQRPRPSSRVMNKADMYCTRCGKKKDSTEMRRCQNQDVCVVCLGEVEPPNRPEPSPDALAASQPGDYYANEKEAPLSLDEEKNLGFIPKRNT